MKLFRRDGQWHVDFRDAEGVRKRFSTGVSSTEPQRVAERVASERMRNHLVGAKATPVEVRKVGGVFNLAEALERTYLQRWKGTKSDVQLKYVVRRLEREIGHWLLTEVNFNKLEDYQQDLLRMGKSRATVNRRMSHLKVVLRHCAAKGDIAHKPEFPEALSENNVRERYLQPDEEARVREYLDRRMRHDSIEHGETWLYMGALFDFLLDTGCRLGEALALKRSDGRVVHLEHGTTKSNKARVVPLTPRAAPAAKLLLESPLHGKVDGDWVGHRWGLVRKACGIPDVNIHILRHSCASRLLAAGVGLLVVKEWLGHSSVKVTERYAHLQSGALENAAALLARASITVVESPAPQAAVSAGTQR